MKRLDRFREFQRIGCIACRMNGHAGEPADIHHLLSGGRRRGDEYTIPLCAWHHRGQTMMHCSRSDMTEDFGPSLAHGSRAFRAHYGSDDELLAKVEVLLCAST